MNRRRCSRTAAALGLALSLPVLFGMDEPEPDPAPIAESRASFDCQGKAIAAEVFEPTGPGRRPVVVLLYGSGGMTVGGPVFREFARGLARRGYLVVLPHYFQRTGTVVADPRTIPDRFKDWTETVAEAITFAMKRPGADPDRVGLLGFSLGGYLALSESTFDPRVKAVVEFFGGLPEQLADRAPKLPPTLVLHGDADTVVKVDEAHKLRKLLEQHKIDHDIQIYQGAGHGFLGAEGRDAEQRTRAFFDKYLTKRSG